MTHVTRPEVERTINECDDLLATMSFCANVQPLSMIYLLSKWITVKAIRWLLQRSLTWKAMWR